MATTLAAALLFAAGVSVTAKTPYFTVTIEPAVPTSGQPFLVVVRTWEDIDHSIPAGFDAAEALGGLLIARPSGDSADVAISLLLREPDTFEGRLTLPAGDWTLIAFPNRTGWSSPTVPVGYPDTIPLSVREPTSVPTGLVAVFASVAAVFIALALLRRPRVMRGRGKLGVGLFALALATCSSPSPTPTPVPSQTLAASTASPSPKPVTMADAERCLTTKPGKGPPNLQSALFGWGNSYGNGKLWVGGLWPDGVIAADSRFVEKDGSVGMKFGWWHVDPGKLAITGRRLDGAAPSARGDVPDGYGQTGFQASGVYFPTEGCWEITGHVGATTLTFVTFVIKVGT